MTLTFIYGYSEVPEFVNGLICGVTQSSFKGVF